MTVHSTVLVRQNLFCFASLHCLWPVCIQIIQDGNEWQFIFEVPCLENEMAISETSHFYMPRRDRSEMTGVTVTTYFTAHIL